MKKLSLLLVAVLTIGLAACPAEKGARDTAAALQGSLLAGQARYQASCSANPSQSICQLINRGISAQNALVTATQAYCGWSAATPPADVKAPCVPVKGAEASLNAAIANARQITGEIKKTL